jgi:hypothetical protein
MPNGTGWVNWDQVLAANQPRAQQMADQVAGGIQQQGQAAQTGITGLSNDFDAAAKAGTGVTTYTGPKALSELGNYGAVQQQAGQAQQNAALTATSGGIDALVGQQYGPRGNSAFDGALAGTVGAGRFTQLRQQYGGLMDALGGAETAAAARSKAAQAEADGRAASQVDLAPTRKHGITRPATAAAPMSIAQVPQGTTFNSGGPASAPAQLATPRRVVSAGQQANPWPEPLPWQPIGR